MKLPMVTTIRPQISEKNKYWISKHRHYELKHFCLQYVDWKRNYINSDGYNPVASESDTVFSDRTAKYGILRAKYIDKIKLIENAAKEADSDLYEYILLGVTEGLSYTHLKTKLNIPCGRDMYYDRYRRFFWILSNSRN